MSAIEKLRMRRDSLVERLVGLDRERSQVHASIAELDFAIDVLLDCEGARVEPAPQEVVRRRNIQDEFLTLLKAGTWTTSDLAARMRVRDRQVEKAGDRLISKGRVSRLLDGQWRVVSNGFGVTEAAKDQAAPADDLLDTTIGNGWPMTRTDNAAAD